MKKVIYFQCLCSVVSFFSINVFLDMNYKEYLRLSIANIFVEVCQDLRLEFVLFTEIFC